MKSIRRLLLKLGLAAGVSMIALFGCLYAAEWICWWSDPQPDKFWYSYSARPLPISKYEYYEPVQLSRLQTMIAPNVHYEGPAPWEASGLEHTKLSTDEWGFFSDIPYAELLHEKKTAREFRVIVVGGSGAQGHGATSLEATFEKQLEKSLTKSLASVDPRFQARVYNLALAGHIADDNFYILHRFGIPLDPDLIVFYSGPNDLAHLTFQTFPAVLDRQTQRNFEQKFAWENEELSPEYVLSLNRLFPYLGRKNRVFHRNAQVATPAHYADVSRRLKLDFIKRWGIADSDDAAGRVLALVDKKRTDFLLRQERLRSNAEQVGRQLYERLPLHSFVDSVKSVKRDFVGIPIVIAWQLINHQVIYDNWFDVDGIYERFFADARAQLTGYMNERWRFLQMAELAKARVGRGAYPDLTRWSFEIHLDDAGHRLVADILHDEVLPLASADLRRRSKE